MNKTALLLIDVQKAFSYPSWGERNNPDAEKNIGTLLTHWRTNHMPVIHVAHNSINPKSLLHPSNPGNEIKLFAKPQQGEILITKSVNSAFIGTGLEYILTHHGIKNLVIVGFTTDHCVSTTVRMATNLGFNSIVVSDAVATFAKGIYGKIFTAEQVHDINLASLKDEFAKIMTTEEVLGKEDLWQ